MRFNEDLFFEYMNNEFNYGEMKPTIKKLLDSIISYGDMHFKNEDLRSFLQHTVGNAFDISDKDMNSFFESVQRRTFDGYCNNKIDVFEKGTSSICLYDASNMDKDEAVEYSVAFRQKLRTNNDKWDDCYVLYQTDLNYSEDLAGMYYIPINSFKPGEVYDVNFDVINNTPMVDEVVLACRMEFSSINAAFLDDIHMFWNDLNANDLFTNPLLRTPFILVNGGDYLDYADRWFDKDGNGYLAMTDSQNQYWVGVDSVRDKFDDNRILCYHATSIPEHDIIEADYIKQISETNEMEAM